MSENKYYKKERIESKLKSYLAEAESEYNAYKHDKSRNTTLLAEAGEKLWGAFNYYMELKVGASLKTAAEVRSAVYAQEDTNLISLYDKASFLHQFFYGCFKACSNFQFHIIVKCTPEFFPCFC